MTLALLLLELSSANSLETQRIFRDRQYNIKLASPLGIYTHFWYIFRILEILIINVISNMVMTVH